jgi:glutaredoxin
VTDVVLYRMVLPDHVCPFGVASLELLKGKGLEVDDRPLRTREETEALKDELGVDTTPQTFIDGRRIGGYDDLRRHFGLPPD